MNRKNRDLRAGHTLVEVVLAGAILAIFLGSLTLFARNAATAVNTGASQADLDARLRRVLRRIGEELLPSGLSVITPQPFAPEGGREIVYRRSEGQINGRIRWGAPRRIAFALEPGELDDGLDNDGNGLADDGRILWTMDLGTPSEQTVVLIHGVRELGRLEEANGLDDDQDGRVDEPGLAFRIEGNTLRISLTIEQASRTGPAVVRTLETVVQPRN